MINIRYLCGNAGVRAALCRAGRSRSAMTGFTSKKIILRSFSDSHDDFKPKRKEVPSELDDVIKLVEEQVKSHDVMLYMKGTPHRPQCGFSGRAVQILNAVGVDFASVNVLEYPSIREGVKAYASWPTIPQLYIKGEFVGGADIIASMYNEGELVKLLQDKEILKKD